jgi:hypothetical protein
MAHFHLICPYLIDLFLPWGFYGCQGILLKEWEAFQDLEIPGQARDDSLGIFLFIVK